MLGVKWNYVINYIIRCLQRDMPNKKSSETNIRKLTKLGGKSIGLTLPIELVRELGWREKQRVVVKKIKGGFTVRDYRRK